MSPAGAPAVDPIVQSCRKAHVRTAKRLLASKIFDQKVCALFPEFLPVGAYAESSQPIRFNIFPPRSYKDPVLQHLGMHVRLLKWIPRKIHLIRIWEIIITQWMVNPCYKQRWREFHLSERTGQIFVLGKPSLIDIVQSMVWNNFLRQTNPIFRMPDKRDHANWKRVISIDSLRDQPCSQRISQSDANQPVSAQHGPKSCFGSHGSRRTNSNDVVGIL